MYRLTVVNTYKVNCFAVDWLQMMAMGEREDGVHQKSRMMQLLLLLLLISLPVVRQLNPQ